MWCWIGGWIEGGMAVTKLLKWENLNMDYTCACIMCVYM